MNPPYIFLSYCHADDKWTEGRISGFRDGLVNALRIVTGKHIEIFQDRDIGWGDHWPDTLEKALAGATILMPIITPCYFTSGACREELETFFEYEKRSEKRRILPVYWMDCDEWEDQGKRDADRLASELYNRQYWDWRPLVGRLPRDGQPPRDQRVKSKLESIAKQVHLLIPELPQIDPPRPVHKTRTWLIAIASVLSVLTILAVYSLRDASVADSVFDIIDRAFGGAPSVPSVTLHYLGDKHEDEIAYSMSLQLRRRFHLDTGVSIVPTYPDRIQADKTDLKNQINTSDVVLLDIIWLDELSELFSDISLLDLGATTWYPSPDIKKFVRFWKDIGLLYYRKDLAKLEDVSTWEQLTKKAVYIQKGIKERKLPDDFIAFAWPGGAYEGLTCNALEWIASNGGVQEDDGRIKYESQELFEAINTARNWVKGVKDKDVPAISSKAIEYTEEESLQAFLEGKSAFLRAWPYAYAALKKRFGDKLGVAPLPQGQDHRYVGVLGGPALAVPQRSRNKIEALEFIQYLTSEFVQKWRAERGSYVPPGGGGPSEVDAAIKRIDVEVVRTSSERGELGQPGKPYESRSACFAKLVREAIQSDSEQDARQKIHLMPSCQLSKVRLKSR